MIRHHNRVLPFKYFNAGARDSKLFEVVRTAGGREVNGTPMFIVVKKLQPVKKDLVAWRKSKPDVNSRTADSRLKLASIQGNIANGNSSAATALLEKEVKGQLEDFLLMEERMMKQ